MDNSPVVERVSGMPPPAPARPLDTGGRTTLDTPAPFAGHVPVVVDSGVPDAPWTLNPPPPGDFVGIPDGATGTWTTIPGVPVATDEFPHCG